MEVRARRKDQTLKHEARAGSASVCGGRAVPSSQPTADGQSSFTSGVRSVLGRVVTWIKRSALFSWLHHAGVKLKQSIMGNRTLAEALMRTGLWLLLLWLLSNLHMGLPCFLLALVFWLYNTYGGGPPPSTAFSWRQQEGRS